MGIPLPPSGERQEKAANWHHRSEPKWSRLCEPGSPFTLALSHQSQKVEDFLLEQEASIHGPLGLGLYTLIKISQQLLRRLGQQCHKDLLKGIGCNFWILIAKLKPLNTKYKARGPSTKTTMRIFIRKNSPLSAPISAFLDHKGWLVWGGIEG